MGDPKFFTDGKYILDEKRRVVKCNDLLEWGLWFETADRLVKRTEFTQHKICVSTVFLAMDHSWGQGEPLLFETMVFGEKEYPSMDSECERYHTWHQAEKGHDAMVEKVMKRLPKNATLKTTLGLPPGGTRNTKERGPS